MNDIARLWRNQKASIGHWDRLGIQHKTIIRQSFIAGCEAMRDEMNCPAEITPADYFDEHQLGLRLVGGSDND